MISFRSLKMKKIKIFKTKEEVSRVRKQLDDSTYLTFKQFDEQKREMLRYINNIILD